MIFVPGYGSDTAIWVVLHIRHLWVASPPHGLQAGLISVVVVVRYWQGHPILTLRMCAAQSHCQNLVISSKLSNKWSWDIWVLFLVGEGGCVTPLPYICSIQIPASCERVTAHGKGTSRMWLHYGFCCVGVILDYLGGLLPKAFSKRNWVRERSGWKQREARESWLEVPRCCFWRWKKGPSAKECRWPVQTGKGKETNSAPSLSNETTLPTRCMFASHNSETVNLRWFWSLCL